MPVAAAGSVVAAGKLKELLPPKAHPKDAEEFIRELVTAGHLTRFHAQQVALGKAKALVEEAFGQTTLAEVLAEPTASHPLYEVPATRKPRR